MASDLYVRLRKMLNPDHFFTEQSFAHFFDRFVSEKCVVKASRESACNDDAAFGLAKFVISWNGARHLYLNKRLDQRSHPNNVLSLSQSRLKQDKNCAQ